MYLKQNNNTIYYKYNINISLKITEIVIFLSFYKL